MKKIAVVGFGFMGAVHTKNIIESSNLELCGIIDNREGDIFAGIELTGNHGQLNLPFEELSKVPVFKSIEACCDTARPDALSICVPLFLHYEMARKALLLGLDVLLEKPFCQDTKQCEELIELAKRHKRILMVAHCIRFAPEWEFLAQCIRDKRYGELQLLSTGRLGGEPTWGVWLNPEIKKTCGGALFDLLIHDIDFANYCLGTPENVEIKLNAGEYYEISMQYPGITAQVSVKGGFLHQYTPFAAEFAATFENGSIRYNTMRHGVIEIGTDGGYDRIETCGDLYRNELEYFAQCICTRKSPAKCLPESSMLAIDICRKIKQTVSG